MASNPQPEPHTFETEYAMTLIDAYFECLFPPADGTALEAAESSGSGVCVEVEVGW